MQICTCTYIDCSLANVFPDMILLDTLFSILTNLKSPSALKQISLVTFIFILSLNMEAPHWIHSFLQVFIYYAWSKISHSLNAYTDLSSQNSTTLENIYLSTLHTSESSTFVFLKNHIFWIFWSLCYHFCPNSCSSAMQ